MASPTEPAHKKQARPISHLVHSTAANLLSLFASPKTTPSTASTIRVAFLFPNSPKPLAFHSAQPDFKSAMKGVESSSESNSGFPSTVRIAGLNSNIKGGGPAFVGQVFSMCDLSGTGLMAVSTHFDIPFISKRTPEWLKKMFASVTNSERNGPVFRFFMDLGDAVTYVKRLNIPSGVVGACRLDLAYEHFKEKPHLFQFVPNEKQVKAANKLLKAMQQNGRCKRVDGVPVFSAQNLDIAIASSDGIKWYTPYFFDKNMLDNILEESVDQHFHSLIQTRHMQRRRDVIDDSLPAEVIEEMGDNLWEPPEVQEVMDEMGNPGIPLSVISKAAEMQLLYAVDKVLLGNRWLRKATGIQPKFPYMVDSFERRSAASFLRASQSSNRLANREAVNDNKDSLHCSTSEVKLNDDIQTNKGNKLDLRFPFGDWFSHLLLKQKDQTEELSKECVELSSQQNPNLPKITMVGISTGEAGQMSKATLKKTMEDLTKVLEQPDAGNAGGSDMSNELRFEDRDPLFVANVGDYYSGMARTGSARWVRGGNN
ncbi:unnamed protein product [Prunus armeniaca]|uniref:Tic22-like family protein n=1 Tax=Prunus armeniaca TaxID=36596 RepID=A0A6J5U7H3_PRUAR|nr:unnamed protein product [Prunus armeniaca]